MKLKSVLIIFHTLLSSGVWAQDSISASQKVLHLKDLLAAIDQNPGIRAFDEKIRSYASYSEAARSLDAPRITTGLWMYPYRRNNDPMSVQNGGSFMIGAEQMIMNPTKRKAEQEYMAGMSSVEETMKRYEKQDMIKEAKKIYYEWMILEKKLRVLKESEALLNVMIQSGEIGYTYNQNLLSRVYKAKSELYSVQNMQLMLESETRQMNAEVNTFMNVDKAIRYSTDTSYTIHNYDMEPLDTSALKANRSDVRNIEESMRLFALKKNFEWSRRKPDFGIQYAHMNGFRGMPNQFNLMGMVTIPIAPWSAKGYKANIQGIKYEMSALDLRKQAVMNEAAGKLFRIKTDIASKKKQVEMYERNIIPALEKNFNTSRVAFEHMKEDMFMTIDAWVALKMARIEYLDLLGQLLKLQADYERETEQP